MAALLAVLPACGASAGGWGRRVAAKPAAAPYVVYRPAFRAPVDRPWFISGYAGYNYGQGPRASYAPKGYLLQYEPTSGHAHQGWFGR